MQELNTDKGEIKKEHSLKKRYFYKLISNFVGFGINIIIAGIVPRGLGPKYYGDYNFLTSILNQVKSFLDMGVSAGFYNKVSQRQNEKGLILFYFQFLSAGSCLILLFIFFLHVTGLHTTVFPDQKLLYIYMSAIFVILTWFGQGFDQMADAFGLTIYSERARILQKVLGVALLIVLFLYQVLTLRNYFYYQYFNQILLVSLFVWVINRDKDLIGEKWKLTLEQIKTYFFEFYHYSFPLFIDSSVALLAAFGDRWLLQKFAGSIQQGFYGLSYNIGALCFLFTGAMTPLLMREYSIAFAGKDLKKMAALFRRYVPMLYSLSAFFSCFILMQSDKVIYILGGSGYKTANVAVKIMALYPLHQTYGQLSSAVLLAAGKTKIFRNVGVFVSVIGLIITFFLIAPQRFMGLNAGATGLAIKMVFVQVVVVNIYLFFNSKFLNISFWRYLAHQAGSFGLLLLISAGITFITGNIALLKGNIVNFFVSGFFYTASVIWITYRFPVIFGLKHNDIVFAKEFIRKKLVMIRGN